MIAGQLTQLNQPEASGLCLEFILHTYAQALGIALRLESATALAALQDLQKLCRGSLSRDPLEQPGVLDKLCFYCEALVQNTEIGDEPLNVLYDLRNKIFSFISQYTRSHQRLVSETRHEVLKPLISFFTHLIPAIKMLSHSEVVLFSLLELRETLNGYLGSDTIEQVFRQLFPQGVGTLRQTIIDGFHRRGFDEFCKQHEALFEKLAWDNSTP
jgi:uncharacterized protein YggT (Ycf19 family)